MKILFLSPVVPYPPVDGDRQRSYHLLQALARQHEVQLLCFYQDPGDAAHLAELKRICARVEGVRISRARIVCNSVAAWFGRRPLNVAAFNSPAMRRRIRVLVRENAYDAVHAYRLRMAPYALNVPARIRVLDYTDALTRYFEDRLSNSAPLWKKAYLARESKHIAAYEAWAGRHFTACLISSPQDRQALLTAGAGRNIRVISNGVDLEQFSFKPDPSAEKVLLFVGNLRYPPNAEGLSWFCRQVWPGVQTRVPEAKLLVVGKPPAKPAHFPGAEFAGVVADIVPYYHRARMLICPLQVASGRQFKVIEAFAAGVPVVATAKVAANLGAQPDTHLLVADQAQAFADQTIRLLQDAGLAGRLRQAARELAKKEFSWTAAARQVQDLYSELAQAAPKPQAQ